MLEFLVTVGYFYLGLKNTLKRLIIRKKVVTLCLIRDSVRFSYFKNKVKWHVQT